MSNSKLVDILEVFGTGRRFKSAHTVLVVSATMTPCALIPLPTTKVVHEVESVLSCVKVADTAK